MASVTSSPPTLATLPAEIHLKIFKILDPVSATCLGLSSRNFYCIYVELYEEAVPIETYLVIPPNRLNGFYLFDLLKAWMGPLVFCIPRMKFITKEKMEEVMGAIAAGGWVQWPEGMGDRVQDEEWAGFVRMMDALEVGEREAGLR
jgi:hypothetical protein